jgi:PilZ domain
MSFQDQNLPKSTSDAEAQRIAKRDSLFLGANVRVNGEVASFDVRVRNLSAGGLLAEAKRCPPADTRITIDLRNIGEIPARIIWSETGKFGVAFDAPIDPQAVRLPVGKGPRANDPVLRPMYPITGRSVIKR